MKASVFRMLRSGICLLLVLCMVVGMCPVTALAQETGETGLPGLDGNGDGVINYVSLGDSMTNGYGLPGYGKEGSMHGNGLEDYAFAAYANRFAAYLAGWTDEQFDAWAEGNTQPDGGHYFEGPMANVHHDQLAMSGLRAEDLHWLLEMDWSDWEAVKLTDDRSDWGKDTGRYEREKLSYWEDVLRDKWNAAFDAGDFWTWDRISDDCLYLYGGYWSTWGVLRTGYTDFPSYYKPGTHANTVDPEQGSGDWLIGNMGMVAKYYQDKVAAADVITLSVGTGNFGAWLMERVTEVANFDGKPADVLVYDIESAMRDLEPGVKAQVESLLTTSRAIMESMGIEVDDGNDTTFTTMEAMAHIMLYAIVSYAANYAGALEAILELNEDPANLEIIIVGLMNTFTEQEGAEVEGMSLGALMEALFPPLNKYIAALPAILKQNTNSVFADADIYYAEADFVECLVADYEDLIHNPSSTVRVRFVRDIIDGIIWGLLGGVKLPGGIELIRPSLDEVNDYDRMTDVQRIQYAAANEMANASKAASIAVYLAIEDAIIKAANAKAVDVLTFMNVGDILAGGDLFGGVMEKFLANAGNITDSQLEAVATVVAAMVNETLAKMLTPEGEEVGEVEEVVDYNDILVLMDAESATEAKNAIYYKLIVPVAASYGYELNEAEVEAVLTAPNGAAATEVYYKLVEATVKTDPNFVKYNWLTAKMVKAIAEEPNGVVASAVYCKMTAEQANLSDNEVAAIIADSSTAESKDALYKLVKATIDATPAYKAYSWLEIPDIKAIDTEPDKDAATAVYYKIAEHTAELKDGDIANIMADNEPGKMVLYGMVAKTLGMGLTADSVKEAVENEGNILHDAAINAVKVAKNEVVNGIATAKKEAIDLVSKAIAIAAESVVTGFGTAKAESAKLVGEAMVTAKTNATTLLGEGLVTAKAACDEAVKGAELPRMLLGIPTNLSKALQDDDTVAMLLALFGRAMIASGIGAHPSEEGHKALFEAIKASYAEKNTVEEEVDRIIAEIAPDAAFLKDVYYYLVANEYITLEQTIAIVNYLAVNMDALQQSGDGMVDMAKFVYELLLHNDGLSDADKGSIVVNIYLIVRNSGKLGSMEVLDIVDAIYAYLSGNEYITDEQVFAIVDHVYGNMDALMAGDNAVMVEMAKFVYETLLHNEDLSDEAKGEIVVTIYFYIRSTGVLNGMAVLDVVDEIYDCLSAYISLADVFEVVDYIYGALTNDGEVLYDEVRQIAKLVYFDVLAVDEVSAFALQSRAMPQDMALTPADKVAIIEDVYSILENKGYLNTTEYPELGFIADLYFDLTDDSAPLVTEEQALAIFDAVMETFVDNESIGDGEITELAKEICDVLLADSDISDATKVAIVDKVTAALENSGMPGGESVVPGIEEIAVLKELFRRLKAADLMGDEQAVEIINYLYPILLSGNTLSENDLVGIVEHIYAVVFTRDDLTTNDKVEILTIIYTTLDEYGYVDKAIDYVNPYYQVAIMQVLTAENVEMVLGYIDAAITAVEDARAAVDAVSVPQDLTEVKEALDAELDAALATLNKVRDIVTDGQLSDIRGAFAALLSVRDELSAHITNIADLANKLGVAKELYITKVINAADHYGNIISTFAEDAYNWVIAYGKDFADGYTAFVKEVVASVSKISPALAAVVEEYLTKTPAEALAIMFTAGENAVNEFVAAAVSLSKDIDEIITGLSAILKTDVEVLVKALEDARIEAVNEEIAIVKAKIEKLRQDIHDAPVETVTNYEVLLQKATEDLVDLQNRLVATILTVVAEKVDPATSAMIEKIFAALESAIDVAGTAGEKYGEWFAGRFDEMAGELLSCIIINTQKYGFLAGDIIEEMISEFITQVKQDVKDKYDEIIGNIEIPNIDLSEPNAVIDQLNAIADNIRNQLNTLKGYAGNEIAAQIENLEEALVQVEAYAEKLQTLVNDIENLVNKIEEEPELTIDKIQSIVKQTQNIAAEAKQIVVKAKAAMVLLAEVYEEVMPQIVDLMRYVEDGSPADKFADITGQEIDEFIATIVSGYKDTCTAIKNAAGNIDGIVNEAVVSVFESTATAVKAIADATKIASVDIIDAVETAAETIKGEAITLAKSADRNIAAAGKQILDAVNAIELSCSKEDLMAKQTEIENIVSGLISVLENADDVTTIEEAEAVLNQAIAALEALGAISEDIYYIAEDDVVAIFGELAVLADNVQQIVSAGVGSLSADAKSAYGVSVGAIDTAADATIRAIQTAIVAYEHAVANAAGEILATVTSATKNIGVEVVAVENVAVGAINTSIDRAEQGVSAIKAALKDAQYR